MTIPQSPKPRNLVKKHMDKFNRPSVHPSKKDKDESRARRPKHKKDYRNAADE